MNVYNTIKNSLILYPSIYRNALDVYVHLFICIGNGYEWKNGQLVSIQKEKKATVEDGVDRCLKFHLIEHNPVESHDALKDNEEYYLKAINRSYMRMIGYVKDIFNWKDKMNDFSFAWDEDYRKLNARNLNQQDKQMFYNFCHYSRICNLPDNIKKDWLEAAEKMYNIVIENIDRLECINDETELLAKVKERIEELKKKFD
jgi:hypothetical protein